MDLLKYNNIEFILDKFPIESEYRFSFWNRKERIDKNKESQNRNRIDDDDFDFEEYFRNKYKEESKNYGFNLILKGNSDKMLVDIMI